MLCSILSTVYGRDTRAVQMLNTVVALLWLSVHGLVVSGSVIALPNNHSTFFVITTCVAIVVLSISATYLFACRSKQIVKAFALMLGALLHAVIANGYISKYPPLNMMMVVSVTLTFLFGGAVLYILKCEGVDVPRSSNCR